MGVRHLLVIKFKGYHLCILTTAAADSDDLENRVHSHSDTLGALLVETIIERVGVQ